MRAFWCGFLAMAMAWAVTGQAAPVPLPPDGFDGAQYIDRTGCVFVRTGAGWAARRDRNGRPICGFPPTLSSRRTDSEGDGVAETEARSPADMLADTLAAGLRDGEFLAESAPPPDRRDPLPAPQDDPMQAQLDQLVGHDAALRRALSGAGAGGSDLCAMLGYEMADDPAPILGGDVTQGLCAGMRAAVPVKRITAGAASRADPLQAGSPSRSGTEAVSVVQDRRPPASAASARRPVAPKGNADARGPAIASAPTVEMIPASARYVQIGGFADDENAVAAIRRLSAMGFRVAQTRRRDGDRVLRLILAGPFTDRRDLVAALNRLRASGYPGAIAR